MDPTFRGVSMSAVVCAAVLAALALGGGAASAHEGAAAITVDSAEQGGDLVIDYTVSVAFSDDGHAAEGSLVTLVAEGPEGRFEGREYVGPVELEPLGGGIYRGSLQFPEEGTWSLRFTSVTPDGTLTMTQDVSGAASAAPVETTPPTATPSTTQQTDDTAPDDPADEGDGATLPPVLAAAAVAALALGAAFVLRTRLRRTQAANRAGPPHES